MNLGIGLLLAGAKASVSAGITYTDNFNRADSGTLGTASGGFTWQNTTAGIGIVSNQAKGVGIADVQIPTVSYCTVSADITTNLLNFPGLKFNGDGTNANYFGVAVNTNGSLQLFYLIASSFTTIGPASSSGLISSGVSANIQVIVTANGGVPANFDFTVKVNGTTQYTFANLIQGPFGRYAGFFPGNATDTFDNFSAA